MKSLILFSIFFSTQIFAENFNVGFNQAWMKTNFGRQWTGENFDKKEVNRILDLAQNAGAGTLRIWLFEGAESTALQWKDGKVSGLHPDFLKNFEYVLKEAKARGIKIYPTLFTPEPLKDVKDKNISNRWWNLLNDKYGALDAFKENALKPLMNLINKPENKDSIFGVDVANEIDSGVIFNKFERKWDGVNKLLCSLKKEINPTPMTASVGWGMNLARLYEGAENTILKPNPSAECIDFWDLHVYRDSGEIDNCEQIKALIKKYNKKIYLGEFGQDSKSFNDDLQKKNAEAFIRNAQKCGFSGALAWRLSDVRPGHNKEARHSYEAFELNKMRPAFQVIKYNNLKNSLCLNNSKSCSIDPNISVESDTEIYNGSTVKKNEQDDSKIKTDGSQTK